MKRLITTMCFMLVYISASAQNILTHEQVENATRMAEFCNPYDGYTASDGHTYMVGDVIEIGQANNDRVFATYYSGDGFFVPLTAMGAVHAGEKVEIKTINAFGDRNRGFWVNITLKNMARIIKFDLALQNGEVVGQGMTEERALAELRKAKELLELELITEDEYNAKKEELMQYINLN